MDSNEVMPAGRAPLGGIVMEASARLVFGRCYADLIAVEQRMLDIVMLEQIGMADAAYEMLTNDPVELDAEDGDVMQAKAGGANPDYHGDVAETIDEAMERINRLSDDLDADVERLKGRLAKEELAEEVSALRAPEMPLEAFLQMIAEKQASMGPPVVQVRKGPSIVQPSVGPQVIQEQTLLELLIGACAAPSKSAYVPGDEDIDEVSERFSMQMFGCMLERLDEDLKEPLRELARKYLSP